MGGSDRLVTTFVQPGKKTGTFKSQPDLVLDNLLLIFTGALKTSIPRVFHLQKAFESQETRGSQEESTLTVFWMEKT